MKVEMKVTHGAALFVVCSVVGAARPGVQLRRGRRGCCAAIVSIFGTIYLQAAKVGRCRRCHSTRFNGLFTARV